MPKPKNVKLTNQQTCRIVAELTKDPTHFGQCPIIMTREKWDSIRHYVKWKKEEASGKPGFKNVFNDVFGDFFGRS